MPTLTRSPSLSPPHRFSRRSATPSFAGLLRRLLAGAGFTLIGTGMWHLVWAAATLLVWELALPVAAGPVGLLAPLPATAGVVWRFAAVYRQQEAQRFLPPRDTAVKVTVWVGHFFLVFFVGILAAVLIPNLLGTRNRALRIPEQSISRNTVTPRVEGVEAP